MKKPELWTELYDDDSGEYAIVVEALTDPAHALAELLASTTGVMVSPSHPIIQLKVREFGLKAEKWFYYTKDDKRGWGLEEGDDGWDDDVWGCDGSGKTFIWVVSVPQEVYAIADLIETYGVNALNEIEPTALVISDDMRKLKRRDRRKAWLKARRQAPFKINWRDWMGLDQIEEVEDDA